ncbi:tyrosine-type recombinase/integrase [Azospirillum sp.]|uniref:tyrosine-type recombinase/integrase n=1 Tax=Azospirillum sp. TaxID=34012 RepID=UPI003D727436
MKLIEFCAHLASTSGAATSNVPLHLIDYGHPIETGDGNGSSPLRAIMEDWLAANGWSTISMAPPYVTRGADGSRTITATEYRGGNSMPANDLTFTLIVLREKLKPLDQRDLILLQDVYSEDEVPDAKRREPYFHFYKFRLGWMREAARRFVLSKIEHRELSPRSLISYITRLVLLESCLCETHETPRLEHITREFISETFLNWGNARKLAGKNWYADPCNMVHYASNYLADRGWGDIKLDKRNLRRVEGQWPGGRGYQQKVEERTIPEDVVEQMFQRIDALAPAVKRLLILDRYTGMRSADLHALDFDCLKDDPDDDRFMILTFYQGKVKRWNTKPLLKEDAAHALVIKTIQDQQADARRTWGKDTKYLFPTRTGDGETHVTANHTLGEINKWIIEQGIHDADGRPWEFGWHGLRHFYGTELALQGHDIVLIQLELGHGSADMTMVYINRRLQLKKKALLEKGGGRYIDIKGQVDEKIGDLAVRKDAVLAVDVPGGLCALPGQIGEWCDHNRACLTCTYFRADIDQLAFFDAERRSIRGTIARLKQEVAEYHDHGRARMAEIGEKRLANNEGLLVNVTRIIDTIKAEGSYRGDTRRYQRPACRGGGEASPQAPGG